MNAHDDDAMTTALTLRAVGIACLALGLLNWLFLAAGSAVLVAAQLRYRVLRRETTRAAAGPVYPALRY
jgi:hypothetical protein